MKSSQYPNTHFARPWLSDTLAQPSASNALHLYQPKYKPRYKPSLHKPSLHKPNGNQASQSPFTPLKSNRLGLKWIGGKLKWIGGNMVLGHIVGIGLIIATPNAWANHSPFVVIDPNQPNQIPTIARTLAQSPSTTQPPTNITSNTNHTTNSTTKNSTATNSTSHNDKQRPKHYTAANDYTPTAIVSNTANNTAYLDLTSQPTIARTSVAVLDINNPITKNPSNQNTNTNETNTNLANTNLVNTNLSDTNQIRQTNTNLATTNERLIQLEQFYSINPSANQCQGQWLYPNQHPIPIHPIPNDGRLHALADYGYYHQPYSELSGNVIINQNTEQLTAQKVTMNDTTGIAKATGAVMFGNISPEGDLMGIADTLTYRPSTGEAVANHIAFASKNLHAHGIAEQLHRLDNNRYSMTQVSFSTCPPHRRLWQLDADNISLDRTTGRGVAKNTTLRINNVPIFYLPVLDFPIDHRRATGFLLPRLGANSNALQLTLPYYLNLAPNYDATLSPTIYNNKNPRLAGEFRYLNPFGFGVIDAAFLPNDKTYGNKKRGHLTLKHHSDFFDHNLQINANYAYVSDNRYVADFNQTTFSNTPLNLPRNINLHYRDNKLNIQAGAEGFQRLEGADNAGQKILDKDRPYSRLPYFHLTYSNPTFLTGNTHLNVISDINYFKKTINDHSEPEKSGIRLYHQLSASHPITRAYGHFIPTLKLTQLYTIYDKQSLASQNLTAEQGSYAIFAPTIDLDTALYWQKTGAPFGLNNQGKQLLTSQIRYSYTPYTKQSHLPNFDSRMTYSDYRQLLSDSWIIGNDRIGDLHALTPALDYRYLDQQGQTRLHASLAQQYYLDTMNITLGGNPITKGQTQTAWQLSAHPNDHLTLHTSGTSDQHGTISWVANANYAPSPDSLLQFGIIERKANHTTHQQALSAYTAAAIIPLQEHWQLIASTQYDRTQGQFLDNLLGVNYEDCCIGVAIYGRESNNRLDPHNKNRSIMAELRLNGITSEGQLSRLLKQKVLGIN